MILLNIKNFNFCVISRLMRGNRQIGNIYYFFSLVINIKCMFFVVCMFSMILSWSGIEVLLSSGCSCWELDFFDDMWLGNCFCRLGVFLMYFLVFY